MLTKKLLAVSPDTGIKYVGGLGAGATNDFIKLHYPSGTRSGDLVIFIVSTGAYARNWAVNGSTTINHTTSGNYPSTFIGWLVAGGESYITATTSTSCDCAGAVLVFRNAEYSNKASAYESYSPISMPSISSTDGSVVVVAWGTDGYAGIPSGPSDYAGIIFGYRNTTNGSTALLNHKFITADGTEDPNDITLQYYKYGYGNTIELTLKE